MKKKKKKHTWGLRRDASRAPIKCNKKKDPFEGGGGVIACVAVHDGDGGGGSGSGGVVVLAVVVFVVVMGHGGWVLWQ